MVAQGKLEKVIIYCSGEELYNQAVKLQDKAEKEWNQPGFECKIIEVLEDSSDYETDASLEIDACAESGEAPETVCRDKTLIISDSEKLLKKLETEGFCGLFVNLITDSFDFKYVTEDISEYDYVGLESVFLRLRGLPWHIARTERTLIREITVEDVPSLYEIYQDERVQKYTDSLYEKIDDEIVYTKEYIRSYYGFYEYGMWIVEDLETGRVIGRAGLEPLEDRVELGYLIAGDYQGAGIGSEVCFTVMNIAREIFECGTIYARCHNDNKSSLRILEKLGFVETQDEKLNAEKEIKNFKIVLGE